MISDVHRLFALQQQHRWRVAATTAEERRARLGRLRSAIERHRGAVHAAMQADFHKHPQETELTEIQPTLIELDDARRRVARWMRPVRVRTPLMLAGATSELRYEARGVVLIMAPWNYPFQLLLSPLVAAVAAGNCAILRPSEKVPRTSAVLAQIVREAFDESEVACIVEPGIEAANALLTLPFDHIFFTGSIPVGKKVMVAAAGSLASVTLELGGKSPLVVDESADIRQAAKRAVWGKFVNAGQTCVAPDHVLVHERALPEFVAAARAAIAALYGPTDAARRATPDYPRIIDDRAHARLVAMLDDAVAAGARIEIGGDRDAGSRYLAPTIVTGVPTDSRLMREEIFGPILPVIGYRDFAEIPAHVDGLGKPLAIYLFTRRPDRVAALLARTSSGGVVVNNVLVHLANPNLPFGGVGESGQGSYHGWYGFRTFSHERSVMRQGRFGFLEAIYPPYSHRKARLVRWVTRALT